MRREDSESARRSKRSPPQPRRSIATRIWLTALVVALVAYGLVMRPDERRRAPELGAGGRTRELVGGLAAGAALMDVTVCALTLTGAWRIERFNGLAWVALTSGFAQAAVLGVLEELLARGVVLRLAERTFGSAAALVAASLLSGLAHLPAGDATAMAAAVAVAAGALFGAAYLATRRLWLGIGLHVGWSFTSSQVFSFASSGHAATSGLVTGTLAGPDWLTGGAGGSGALTLIVLVAGAAHLLRLARRRNHLVARRHVGAGAP